MTKDSPFVKAMKEALEFYNTSYYSVKGDTKVSVMSRVYDTLIKDFSEDEIDDMTEIGLNSPYLFN